MRVLLKKNKNKLSTHLKKIRKRTSKETRKSEFNNNKNWNTKVEYKS